VWLDEAALTVNIVNRSFSGLLQPLDYAQGAAIGFLLTVKTLTELFGNSEYVLRLFPFVCGTISLFLFYKISKYFLKPTASIIALGLFAISDRLIYYSTELKQYSSDVFSTLILYLAYIHVKKNRLTVLNAFMLGGIGTIAIWMSHPAVFILAGIGAMLIIPSLRKKDWRNIVKLATIFIFWAINFLFLYIISLKDLGSNIGLQKMWVFAFMPIPLFSPNNIRWLYAAFKNIFDRPIWLLPVWFSMSTFVLGGICMFSERKEKFISLTIPIIFTLIASGLHKYPFTGRLLLFLVPVFLFIIAEGAEQIIKRFKDVKIIGIMFLLVLYFTPVTTALRGVIKGSPREEIRPVLEYLVNNRQKGDTIYLFHWSSIVLGYYAERYNLDSEDFIHGSFLPVEGKEFYIKEINKIKGKERVWIIFSHTNPGYQGGESKKSLLKYLDKSGIKVDSFEGHGASIYLYDLSKKGIS